MTLGDRYHVAPPTLAGSSLTHKSLWGIVTASLVNILAGCSVLDKGDKFVYPKIVRELESRNQYYSLENKVREKDTLYVGASVVEITPQADEYIAGFQVGRKSDGVLDELSARTLVLSYNDTTIALVSLDLIGFMNENLDDVRYLVKNIKGNDLDEVIVASTHTHAGPDTIGMWGPGLIVIPIGSGLCEDYMKFLYDKIVESVYRAAKDMKKARLFYASKEVSADKKISRNIRKGFEQSIDRELGVLQFVDEQEQTIATVVNYSCHPEALSNWNTAFSSDFVGPLRDEVEKMQGGTAIFFNGSIGGLISVDVDDNKWSDVEYGKQEMHRIGKALANEVEVCLKMKKVCSQPKIRVYREDFLLPIENWLFEFANDVGLVAKRDFDGSAKTEMVLVDIGGRVQMMTMPGEVTSVIGRRMKQMMSGEVNLGIGLGQDELGYVLDDYNNPAFSYERTMSLGPSASYHIIEQGKKLCGQVKK